jgi:hypothetical protein
MISESSTSYTSTGGTSMSGRRRTPNYRRGSRDSGILPKIWMIALVKMMNSSKRNLPNLARRSEKRRFWPRKLTRKIGK